MFFICEGNPRLFPARRPSRQSNVTFCLFAQSKVRTARWCCSLTPTPPRMPSQIPPAPRTPVTGPPPSKPARRLQRAPPQWRTSSPPPRKQVGTKTFYFYFILQRHEQITSFYHLNSISHHSAAVFHYLWDFTLDKHFLAQLLRDEWIWVMGTQILSIMYVFNKTRLKIKLCLVSLEWIRLLKLLKPC